MAESSVIPSIVTSPQAPVPPGRRPELPELPRDHRAGLARALGGDLDSVILHGSQARGGARGPDSDIDVLIVPRGPFDPGGVTERTSELAARLSLEHDALISRGFATKEDFGQSRMPFFLNVRREGAPV